MTKELSLELQFGLLAHSIRLLLELDGFSFSSARGSMGKGMELA